MGPLDAVSVLAALALCVGCGSADERDVDHRQVPRARVAAAVTAAGLDVVPTERFAECGTAGGGQSPHVRVVVEASTAIPAAATDGVADAVADAWTAMGMDVGRAGSLAIDTKDLFVDDTGLGRASLRFGEAGDEVPVTVIASSPCHPDAGEAS